MTFRWQTEHSLKSRRYKVKPRQFSEKNLCEFSKSQRATATDFIFCIPYRGVAGVQYTVFRIIYF